MMQDALSNGSARTREIDKYLKGLVDTSFEEGQYEAGIALLSEMHSAQILPTPVHVRELMFLALYPPLMSTLNERALAQEELAASPTKLSSPSKLRPKLQPLIPTASATKAAMRHLFDLARNTPPSAFMRALPSYEAPYFDGPGRMQGTDDESYIARESQCLLQCRSVWDLLRDDVVRPKAEAFVDIKGKKRRRVDEQDIDEELGLDPSAVIGKNAWPMLELLVVLFERDCAHNEVPYSRLLLEQIPPPRAGTSQRSEMDIVLNVVLTCFDQKEGKRRGLGTRLLTQLIHLLASQQIDSSRLVELVIQRLQSNDWQVFSAVLRACDLTLAGLYFKMLLCRRILQTGDDSSARAPVKAKSRPQPRARGRTTRRTAQDDPATPNPPTDAPQGTGELRVPGISGPLVRVEDICNLLVDPAEIKGTTSAPELYEMARAELSAAYIQLRRRSDATEAGGSNPLWLETTRLGEAVRTFCDTRSDISSEPGMDSSSARFMVRVPMGIPGVLSHT